MTIVLIAGFPAGNRRPGASAARPVAAAAHDLATLPEADLAARVLTAGEPAAEVLRCSARLSHIPFGERRALGVSGLVIQHGVRLDRALRLAALWELAARWYPQAAEETFPAAAHPVVR